MSKEKTDIKHIEPDVAAKEDVQEELTPQIIAREVVSELKKQGLIKENRSAFQKTETLLYNYNNFKEAIKNKYKQIETIKTTGGFKKSASITTFSSNSYFENIADSEKAEEQIIKIAQSILVTQNFIKLIDDAVSKLKEEPYSKIISLKYFENKSREEIAEMLNCDVKTVTRNKNKLINKLKIDLFSDEAILEMIS